MDVVVIRLIGLGEGDHLDPAGQVFEAERAHPLVLLGLEVAEALDDSGHGHFGPGIAGLLQVADEMADHAAQALLVLGQRVAGDVETQGVLLIGQLLGFVPFAHLPDLGRDFLGGRVVGPEEERLAGGLGPLGVVVELDHLVDEVKALGAEKPQRIESPGLDQAL